MGGMTSEQMDSLASTIWNWCLDKKIFISAVHIAGNDNTVADFYSRNFSDSTEWMLKSHIFNRLCGHFFTPNIDLFASRLNKQLPRFVSWFPEPDAFANDAFSISWQSFHPYIFPPFSLMGKVINKIVQDHVEKALLVFPFWKSQPWFPLILSIISDFPVRLPRHTDLLTLAHNGEKHPLAKKMTLVGVIVSGNLCCVKDFHEQLSTLSYNRGGKAPKNSIGWLGSSGIFGVCNNLLIPFLPLKCT
jgi:hypothetical protein